MTGTSDAAEGSAEAPAEAESAGGALLAPTPSEHVFTITEEHPLTLDSGRALAPVRIAYQTLGALNEDRSNVILVCHALTGDQYLAGKNPATGRPGWWETMVGPGKTLDTNRFLLFAATCWAAAWAPRGPRILIHRRTSHSA